LIGDLAIELHGLFEDGDVRHAFGGALALNCYAEPRGSVDVDVNVAVPFAHAEELVGDLGPQGFQPLLPPSDWMPAAGVRLTRGHDIVDVFLAFDPYHQRMLDNAVLHPFPHGHEMVQLPVLSANDLVVVKLAFNRTKDWADIEAMLLAGTVVDFDYVRQQAVAFKGDGMHPRLARLRRLLEARTDDAHG
jgi:hypothetical protein